MFELGAGSSVAVLPLPAGPTCAFSQLSNSQLQLPAPAGDPVPRNNFASASSVSRFPHDRMRDITSERFALVNTSGMIAILRRG